MILRTPAWASKFRRDKLSLSRRLTWLAISSSQLSDALTQSAQPDKSKSRNMDETTERGDSNLSFVTFLQERAWKSAQLRLDSLLGKGAAGEVFSVSLDINRSVGPDHNTEQQIFAMKVVRPSFHIDQATFEQIVGRECQIMKLLTKAKISGIPAFYGHLQSSQAVYIFMEKLSGKNLSKLVHEKKKLAPEVILTITAQIAQIMKGINSNKVLYSDLKPDNIIITVSGEVKLIDFGSAKKCAIDGTNGQPRSFIEEELSELEMEGIGTPEYLAPEFYNMEGLCLESDVWSFG